MNLNTIGIFVKAGKAIMGIEPIKRFLKKRRIKKGILILASDASLSSKRKAFYLSKKYNINLIEKGTKRKLAKFFKRDEVSLVLLIYR
jgi:ribosomal protein L30E